MFNNSRLITIGMTLAIVAVIWRVEKVRDVFTGDDSWF